MFNSAPPPVVLLVDPDQDSREMYGYWLDCCGFLVHVAGNADDALRLTADSVPDVIATEMVLPRTDGYELCRRIRRDALTTRVRLIAVTASAMTQQIEQAYQAGCDLCLPKPCLPETLSVAIRELLLPSHTPWRTTALTT